MQTENRQRPPTVFGNFRWFLLWILPPIGSMYGIFTNIYHKNQPNVGKYTIHGSYGPWQITRCFTTIFATAESLIPKKRTNWPRKIFHPIKWWWWLFDLSWIQRNKWWWRENTWVFQKYGYPQIIHFNRSFHYKPSILGVPLFLEIPAWVSHGCFTMEPLIFSSQCWHSSVQISRKGPLKPAVFVTLRMVVKSKGIIGCPWKLVAG